MNDRSIGFGILGCSDIARRRFLPALARAGNARLVACASRDREKARRFCSEAGSDAVGYDELLSHDRVEAIYLSLPNELHEEWTLKALARGKHVLCEKPLGLDAASVERMTSLADRHGVLLFENIMYLRHPQHRMIRELVDEGAIGRLRGFRSSFGFTLPAPGGFRLSAGPGGGSFQDQARYPLSGALCHLRGELREFAGFAQFRNGVDVSLQACGRSSLGEQFFCSIGFEQTYECWYELVGDRGTLRLDRAYTTPADLANTIKLTTEGGVRSIAVPAADHFQLTIEHVAGLIARRQGFGEAHAQAIRLARAAEQLWTSCTKRTTEDER